MGFKLWRVPKKIWSWNYKWRRYFEIKKIHMHVRGFMKDRIPSKLTGFEDNFAGLFCPSIGKGFFAEEWKQFVLLLETLGNSKPRQRQRERHQTKSLMSRIIAVHVCFESLYISLTSSTKQQREMTNFCIRLFAALSQLSLELLMHWTDLGNHEFRW